MIICSTDQVQASQGSQNEHKTLLQCSQHCHKGEFWHDQCTIITTWTETSWAFPESYTVALCARAMADNGETKGLITPPARWVSAQILYVCVTAWYHDPEGV